MAGLISPKPLSYLQHNVPYNPYQRAGVVSFPDGQNAAGAQLTIHTPDQSLAAMMEGSPALTMAAHEEQKIYALVIQLLDPASRESALLELSKKREQFDELALVLWHSFGKLHPGLPHLFRLTVVRYHACAAPGDRLRLSPALPSQPNRPRFKPRLQRSCFAPMRSFSS